MRPTRYAPERNMAGDCCSVRKEADAKRLQGEFGDFFSPLMFDVTDEKAVLAAAAEVRSRMKGRTLLGLVNNAGTLLLVTTDKVQHMIESDRGIDIACGTVLPRRWLAA